jgi:hypothetical protein
LSMKLLNAKEKYDFPTIDCEKHGRQPVWISGTSRCATYGCCLKCYCDYMGTLNEIREETIKNNPSLGENWP